MQSSNKVTISFGKDGYGIMAACEAIMKAYAEQMKESGISKVGMAAEFNLMRDWAIKKVE